MAWGECEEPVEVAPAIPEVSTQPAQFGAGR